MRVLMNGIAALERKTGVGYYIASLHAALQRQKYRTEKIELYPNGSVRQIIAQAKKHFFTPSAKQTLGSAQSASTSLPRRLKQSLQTPLKEIARNIARRVCHRHFQLQSQYRGIQLYHEPNYLPWTIDLPTVTTVLDLSVLRYPQWHPIDRVKAYEKHFFKGLKQAQHLLTISEFTRQEMIDFLGIPAERITSVHIGIREEFHADAPASTAEVLKKFGLTGGFFLHVGTIEPRKNLSFLIRAFARLPAEIRSRHPLVLVGGWGWQSHEIVQTFDQIGKPAGVRHLGYVADAEIPALFHAAKALVYPSFYEGFGLPPVEMLACGGQVISSTAGSLKEVLGNHAIFVDAQNEEGWTMAMQECSQREWTEQDRQTNIAFASQYTWDACANGTLAVYRQFANG